MTDRYTFGSWKGNLAITLLCAILYSLTESNLVLIGTLFFGSLTLLAFVMWIIGGIDDLITEYKERKNLSVSTKRKEEEQK